MLTRTLKMAFWVMYDHIGKLMVANLLWSLAVAVPGTFAATALLFGDPAVQLCLGVPGLVVTVGVVLPIVSAGLAHMVKVLIDRKDGSVGDMLSGIRLYWGRAAGIGLVYLFLIVCLATSAWFYVDKLRNSAPFVGYALSALAIWCLAFAALAGLLVMPTLVQKREKVIQTLKLAALLVLDNPLLMIGLAVQVLLVTAIVLPLWPLFFVFYGAIVVVMASSAYELLARKYAAAASGTAPAPVAQDEQDDYLNRGVRDVFFPWKG